MRISSLWTPIGGRDPNRNAWLGWSLLVAAYALVAGAWLFQYDLEREGVVYSNAALAAFLVRVLGAHLGLLLVLIAMRVAFTRRSWMPAAACAPLVAFLLWPFLDFRAPPDSNAAGQADLRIMSANLLYLNEDEKSFPEMIDSRDPDIILFQEYTPRWQRELTREIADEYPHVIEHPRGDSYGAAVYSKFPLAEREPDSIALGSDLTPQIRTIVEHPDRRLVIYNLHLMMPLAFGAHTEQRHQVADLVDELRDERGSAIIGGDLNMTETTSHHEAVIKAGFHSAWERVGRGRGATWPAKGFLRYLPGLRLDHVFVSRDLTVEHVEIGRSAGSDHRPVIVDLGFWPSRTNAAATTAKPPAGCRVPSTRCCVEHVGSGHDPVSTTARARLAWHATTRNTAHSRAAHGSLRSPPHSRSPAP